MVSFDLEEHQQLILHGDCSLMGLDHDAIRKAYPSVVSIDDTNSVIKDSSGNDVSVVSI